MDSYYSEIQEEIERVLQNMNRERTNNSRSRSANPTRNATNTSQTNSNTEVISFLRELLYVYNNNIRDYQDNTRMMLQAILLILSNNQQPRASPLRRNTNLWNSRELDNFIYYMIYPSGTIPPINIPAQENVRVAPTQEQIATATINYNFYLETAQSNTNCPITLEEFLEDEPVTRIRHCGHTFRQAAIQNWFQNNVRCPVCRYDIREYIENSENTIQHPVNNNTILQSRIRELMSEYLNMDSSQNQIYTFEFPMYINDLSNNNINNV
jgi:enamine deaminase RidA (YjgF/YER057c/UK114 family)